MKPKAHRPNGSRKLLLAGCVLMAAGAFVFLQHTAGIPFNKTINIPAEIMQPEVNGVAFSASNRWLNKELQRLHSEAAVRENGVRLPFPSHVSEDVRSGGPGHYAFSAKNVWFSSSDGSDPRTNGRRYAAWFPSLVSPVMVALAWLCLGAGVVLVIRGRFGVWVWSWWSRQTHMPVHETPRDWSLDGLRAVAVILVLLRHGMTAPAHESPVLYEVTSIANRGGWIGVDLFFVLSGYLVSGLIFSEYRRMGQVRIGRFLWRRAMKIYPAFWVMLLVSLIGASFGLIPGININGIIGEVLFLQNYIGGIWMHTWTLAVEEHFYLLLAFMFALALENGTEESKERFAFVPRVFATIAVLCLMIRCLRHLYMGPAASLHFSMTHVRLDALMCGVWLRYWQDRHPQQFKSVSGQGTHRWLLAAVLLFVPCFLFDEFDNQWITSAGFTVNYIAAACLLFSSRTWDARWPGLKRWCGPLLVVGRHSYSIYLWHVIVEHWIARPLHGSLLEHMGPMAAWLVYCAVYYAGAIGVGILMGKAIEQPVLHWRDRVFPKPQVQAPIRVSAA